MDPASALETAAPLNIRWQPELPARSGLYPWRAPARDLGLGPSASIVQVELTGAWVPGRDEPVTHWPVGSTFLPVPLPIPNGDGISPSSVAALRSELVEWISPTRRAALIPAEILTRWESRAAELEVLLITAGERLKWTRQQAREIAAGLRTVSSPRNRDVLAAAVRALETIAGDGGVARG